MKEYNGFVNLSYPDRPYVIYTITSSDITDKSIYVGVTVNPQDRAYKHSVNRKRSRYVNSSLYIWMNDVINNKKLKVHFKIIEEQYTEDEGFAREIELVEYYKNLGYIILNDSEGGKGPKGQIPWNKGKKLSKEIIKKLSDAHLGIQGGMFGKSHSEETRRLISIKNKERVERNWQNPKKKPVYKYDLNGNLLTTYLCAEDASKIEKVDKVTIGKRCRRNINRRYKDFIWSYLVLNKEDFYSQLNLVKNG